MDESPTVSSALVNMRIQAAASFGADSDEIYNQAGVDKSILEQVDKRISIEQENAVWRAIVAAIGDEYIGLRIGQSFQLPALGLLGYVLMNTETIGDCLNKFCVYEHLIANTYHHKIVIDNGSTAYEMHPTGPWFEERKHTLDLSMSAVMKVVGELSGHKISPLRVQFQFEQPKDISRYETIFGAAEIEFSCDCSSIAFDKDLWGIPVIGSNPQMFAYFDSKAKALLKQQQSLESYSMKVRRLIIKMLKGDTPSIEAVSGRMAMSVRNLQIKLKNEETSFQKLLDDVRRDIAIDYLNDNLATKSEIAYLLGFSEVGVFSKVFKKWTGQTPSEFQSSARTE